MSTTSLAERFEAAETLGALKKTISNEITDNLADAIVLRPYQRRALERFLYFVEDSPYSAPPIHLLFHMATGSGKTVLMATLMLELFRRGYRNFLFFVDSTQIVEKTKDNFLNPNSPKYLFDSPIIVADKHVQLREVRNFDEAIPDAINILFTTVQGLHTRIKDPKENAVTIEDFEERDVVLISDEAHHLNAETKQTLSKEETHRQRSWESTVQEILGKRLGNILLEFTATVELSHDAVRAKYHDKILYQYTLREFREDGYSKEIELRQADLPAKERMLQALVVSQYRRKVAESHGIHCKPVLLMKSKTIKESEDNERAFHDMVAGLSANDLAQLWTASKGDRFLSEAFTFMFETKGLGKDELVREMQHEFAPTRVANVNRPDDLQRRQIQLNTLEDYHNELRVIFAVEKLNEGWDVLNLFDIVRLYNTRDGKQNKVGKTTMQEAQLIGRGARYYPFVAPDQPDAPANRRKYDADVENPLRILETLHYHCSHNPQYIQDIRNALRQTGLIDESARHVNLRVKDEFKQTEFFQKEMIFLNERKTNQRENVRSIRDYVSSTKVKYPRIMTGAVKETAAFGNNGKTETEGAETVTTTIKLVTLGTATLRYAVDNNPFFHFCNIRQYFPALTSIDEFLMSEEFLGGVDIEVRGPQETLSQAVRSRRKEIAEYALHVFEDMIRSESVEYVGTKEFTPKPIKDVVVDKTLSIGVQGETGRSWEESSIEEVRNIALSEKKWFVYSDNYGTDQEKQFIRYVNDNAQRLKELYEEFFLVRNERLFQIFNFDDGTAFEPDFILFLRKAGGTKSVVLQLFVEPKGAHLEPQDQWKEDFLRKIKEWGKARVVFQGREYRVFGLPFFNTSGQMAYDFEEALWPLLQGESDGSESV
jgi:type III restriction enzyme